MEHVASRLQSATQVVTDGALHSVVSGQTARRPRGATAAFANDAIEIVMTRLDVSPEAVRASAALLSETERQRADRFVFDCDRRRFTVARAQLRRLLSKRLGTQPEAVEFVYGAHGKPSLAQQCAESDLHFNVSHSDDVAAYAFSTEREVGIDIESIRMIRDAKEIAARFFSPSENDAYLALDPNERPVGFFNCWTRKEAFIKALGDGLCHPLDSFDVSLTPGKPAKILRVEDTSGEDCGWTLHSFLPGPGLIGAVVFRKFTCESTSKVDPEQIIVRLVPSL
jgi:4'-phosphopantetheinyl transferase